jgi:hypothetical protein
MRKSLWIFPVLILIGAMGVPNAQAQTFNAVYSCATPSCAFIPVPTNNPITFPLTDPLGTPLGYTFDGNALDTSLSMIDESGDSYIWEVNPGPSGTDFISIVDTASGSTFISADFPAIPTSEVPNDMGDLLFAPTATTTVTPEPGTAVLWLTGLGLMLLMRKRKIQRLRPTV